MLRIVKHSRIINYFDVQSCNWTCNLHKKLRQYMWIYLKKFWADIIFCPGQIKQLWFFYISCFLWLSFTKIHINIVRPFTNSECAQWFEIFQLLFFLFQTGLTWLWMTEQPIRCCGSLMMALKSPVWLMTSHVQY